MYKYNDIIQGYENSIKKLGVDYIDLYLLHSPYWTSLNWRNQYIESWQAMIKLYTDKRVNAIGICNFNNPDKMNIVCKCGLMLPHVNQFEFHPQRQYKDALKICKDHGIQVQSWGTLNQGRLFSSDLMSRIAKKHNKSIAQIAIRWNLQKGNSALVRSTKKERVISNFDIWDFQLTQEEIIEIDKLNGGSWSGIHSEEVNSPIASMTYEQYWKHMQLMGYPPLESNFNLFGFIPFLKCKQKPQKTKWYLWGIPILTIKRKIK